MQQDRGIKENSTFQKNLPLASKKFKLNNILSPGWSLMYEMNSLLYVTRGDTTKYSNIEWTYNMAKVNISLLVIHIKKNKYN